MSATAPDLAAQAAVLQAALLESLRGLADLARHDDAERADVAAQLLAATWMAEVWRMLEIALKAQAEAFARDAAPGAGTVLQ